MGNGRMDGISQQICSSFILNVLQLKNMAIRLTSSGGRYSWITLRTPLLWEAMTRRYWRHVNTPILCNLITLFPKFRDTLSNQVIF